MEYSITTNSENQTIKIAETFSIFLTGGDTVLLNGELGAGKTTFVNGICKGLGIKFQINSPSFTILNKYTIKRNKELIHADFYRLDSINEIINVGIEEFLYDSKYIVLIECPEILKNSIKKEYIEITFSYLVEDYNSRVLTFKSNFNYWDVKLKNFIKGLKNCIF